MKLFVAIYDDCALLPHFITHYSRLGITTFCIAADQSVAGIVQAGARDVDAIVRADLDVLDSFQGGAKAVTQMRSDYCGADEWALIADLDEFVVAESSLPEVLSIADAEGANVVRGRMIDRVAADGSLPPIAADTDIWATFPRKCKLTSQLQGSVDHKGILVRGQLSPTMAHHEFAEERLSGQELEVHHFKWNAQAASRTRTAMEMARAAGISWWREYEKVLRHLDQHGRIRWEDFELIEGPGSTGSVGFAE